MTFALCKKEGKVGVMDLEIEGVRQMVLLVLTGESSEHVTILDDFLDDSLGDRLSLSEERT